MKDGYIVRADYYPDGSIRPLGITDKKGNTFYIDSIEEPHITSKEGLLFKCFIHSKEAKLFLSNNHWIVVFD